MHHNLLVLMYLVSLYFLYKCNHRGKPAKFKAFNSWSYLDSILICFSKLFKEYEGRYSRYCRFLFSPQQCSVEFFKTWPGFKNWKSYSEEIVSLNIQANFQGSVCRSRSFLILENKINKTFFVVWNWPTWFCI